MRDAIVTLFRAVSEAMVVIVRWVLLAGPFGVFALSLGVGLRAGFGAAGTLAAVCDDRIRGDCGRDCLSLGCSR